MLKWRHLHSMIIWLSCLFIKSGMLSYFLTVFYGIFFKTFLTLKTKVRVCLYATLGTLVDHTTLTLKRRPQQTESV